MRSTSPKTRYLAQPGGRIAYDIAGEGPLILLVPGMGDLRGAYRFLAPALAAAGYRVATTDLRGHGESDPTFGRYGDVETAGDIIALIEALGVCGCRAAGPGVRAGAHRPVRP
jgi:pimeloyl-ACP methyl ester carboxylesterase